MKIHRPEIEVLIDVPNAFSEREGKHVTYFVGSRSTKVEHSHFSKNLKAAFAQEIALCKTLI